MTEGMSRCYLTATLARTRCSDPLWTSLPVAHRLQSSCLRSAFTYRIPTRSASQWARTGPSHRPKYNRFNNAQRLRTLWYTSPAFRYGTSAAGVCCGVFYYANLERVPISGRLRFNCFSPQFEEKMARQQVQQVLSQFQGKVLPPGHPDSRMVSRVMKRLIPASGLEHLDWEVKVIDDPKEKNAFVLPG